MIGMGVAVALTALLCLYVNSSAAGMLSVVVYSPGRRGVIKPQHAHFTEGSQGPPDPRQLSSCKLYRGSRFPTTNSSRDSLYPLEQCIPPV